VTDEFEHSTNDSIAARVQDDLDQALTRLHVDNVRLVGLDKAIF
jgi:hypothetical protein